MGSVLICCPLFSTPIYLWSLGSIQSKLGLKGLTQSKMPYNLRRDRRRRVIFSPDTGTNGQSSLETIGTGKQNHGRKRKSTGELKKEYGKTKAHKSTSESEEPSVNQCSICLDTISDKALCDPCLHSYDRECITQWLRTRGTCPYCRASVDAIIHSIVSDTEFEREKIEPESDGVTIRLSPRVTIILFRSEPSTVWIYSSVNSTLVSVIEGITGLTEQLVGNITARALYRLRNFNGSHGIREDASTIHRVQARINAHLSPHVP